MLNFKSILSLFFPTRPSHVSREATPIKDMVSDILGQYGTIVVDLDAASRDADPWWRLEPLATTIGFLPTAEACTTRNGAAKSPRRERFLTLAPARSLDGWWESEEEPHVALVKFGAQGADVDCIKGSLRLLEKAVGCEIDTDALATTPGAPPSEIETLLRDAGFCLWATRENQSPEIVSAVFLRDPKTLSENSPWANRLILAAILEAVGDRPNAQACFSAALGDVATSATQAFSHPGQNNQDLLT